jgi:hypothetical protein
VLNFNELLTSQRSMKKNGSLPLFFSSILKVKIRESCASHLLEINTNWMKIIILHLLGIYPYII